MIIANDESDNKLVVGGDATFLKLTNSTIDSATTTQFLDKARVQLVGSTVSLNGADDVWTGSVQLDSGTLNVDTGLNFISTNDNPALRNVVLLHLSEKNGNPVEFLQKTKETVRYGADCYIAEKGLEVDLSLCPF